MFKKLAGTYTPPAPTPEEMAMKEIARLRADLEGYYDIWNNTSDKDTINYLAYQISAIERLIDATVNQFRDSRMEVDSLEPRFTWQVNQSGNCQIS
jgi:hypothetical protein